MGKSKYEDRKGDFIIMRAKGVILRDIAEALHINIKTAERWNKYPEIEREVTALKAEHYKELKNTLEMNQGERIKAMTATIAQIDEALNAKDLTKLSPGELLTLRLKYLKGLRDEENTF